MLENPTVDTISTEVIQQVTTQQAWHYQIIPFQSNEVSISLYTVKEKISNPQKDELEMLFGKGVELQAVDAQFLQKRLSQYYRREGKSNAFKADLSIKVDQDNNFLENLIQEAHHLGSSDIHMEPYEEKARIRYRIDGALMERYQLDKAAYPGIVNKVKIKAQMDIAEKRLPQDGRIVFADQGHKFDIRVSTLPMLHGEKIVMRLLTNDDTNIDIHKLGFQKTQLEDFIDGVKKPNGLVLISGPTGSGKTTTLYATLNVLNDQSRNILTIEDPIEYTLEGINQVQLKESIGLNFASAMRTFLRQDPDIIMVGEIRDQETGEMAIRASLTGHLVLSTIHTNSAWGIISRLIDMGIPGYMIADTLNLAVAQRLVRKLCKTCKEERAFNPKSYPRQYRPKEEVLQHYVAIGCDSCHFTGYKGRNAIYEIVPIDEELSNCIREEILDVKSILKSKHIQRLSDHAFELFKNGKTTLKEIYPLLNHS